MKITRRRVLSLTGAVAALAMPATALAEPAPETFTLLRAGSMTIIQDAGGENVYIRAGGHELMTPGSAERLGALLAVVREHVDEGVSEITLPGHTHDIIEGRVQSGKNTTAAMASPSTRTVPVGYLVYSQERSDGSWTLMQKTHTGWEPVSDPAVLALAEQSRMGG